VTEPRYRQKLPGNRIIRRRQNATKVITVSDVQITRDVPSVRASAQKFVASFILLVIMGAVLLSQPFTAENGESTPVIDAFFTAMSAGAVTGLVVVDTQDHWNFWGELIILLLIQIGGLGFMVGASLVLASLRRGASLRDTLMLQDGSPTLSLREATDLSRRILRFILVAEAIGATLLTIRFLGDHSPPTAIWYGVFHAVSAFCNAGFDLFGGYRSLTGFNTDVWVNLVIGVLIQCGALSYMVFADVWKKRKWISLALDTKLVLITNLVVTLGGAGLFLVTEWNAGLTFTPDWAKPMAALFQSASVRTAGFSTVSFGDVHSPTIFLWIGLMVIGGASGSTAGGIKLATAAIVVIAVTSTLRGQPDAQAFGRRISPALVFRAMAIITLFLTMFFAITLVLAASEDVMSPNDVTFIALMLESMSAIATAGLSTGLTPEITDPGKIILCIGMLFGRLGPLTAVYALQRRSRPARYRYPEATIRLG
jgi:trk system potassium uptake protein TrkH